MSRWWEVRPGLMIRMQPGGLLSAEFVLPIRTGSSDTRVTRGSVRLQIFGCRKRHTRSLQEAEPIHKGFTRGFFFAYCPVLAFFVGPNPSTAGLQGAFGWKWPYILTPVGPVPRRKRIFLLPSVRSVHRRKWVGRQKSLVFGSSRFSLSPHKSWDWRKFRYKPDFRWGLRTESQVAFISGAAGERIFLLGVSR